MSLYGNVALENSNQLTTHEGANQYNIESPLLDLVFTKGAVVFTNGYYQTQADELKAFAAALRKAEEYEPGFGWKYAAWMRDPKKGKGNRIQGSVAPAILAASNPEDTGLVTEYVAKCLSHRVDDLVAFVSHFENLNLMPISDLSTAVREGIATALDNFSDFQLLKYRGATAERTQERSVYKDGEETKVVKTLRLVDVMGLCKKQLSPRMKAIYKALHSPTREHDAIVWDTFTTQRALFKSGDVNLLKAPISISLPQALSTFGNTRQVWDALFESKLVPDMAFVMNVRNMAKAGYTPKEVSELAKGRLFQGIWPQQMYAGYKAIMNGSTKGKFTAKAIPEYGHVFEEMLVSAVKDLIPQKRSLGFGDISGSMSGELNEFSSLNLMDISKVLCAVVASTSGYAATFDDGAHIANIEGYKGPFDLVLNAPEMNKGWGGTQVYGSVIETIRYIKSHKIEPFEVLYFFSDMQFHPAKGAEQKNMWGNRIVPPLEQALVEWQMAFGLNAPLVVLWNLSSYEGAPLDTEYPGVAFVSGYDSNTFKHIGAWIDNGGRTVSRSKVTGKEEVMAETLDYIRGF